MSEETQLNYPENCLRGISDFTIIDLETGTFGVGLFQFKCECREDGWIEESINWQDDENAVQFTLDQRKDGNIQFKVGVAIIPKVKLDDYIALPAIIGMLSYERRRECGNNYHGNILLKNNLRPIIKKRIAGGLANLVSESKLQTITE